MRLVPRRVNRAYLPAHAPALLCTCVLTFPGPTFLRSHVPTLLDAESFITCRLALLALFTEFFGSIALMVGLLARPAALALTVEMAVAVILVPLPYGFFMDWTGTQGGQGFEYHILFVALTIPVMIEGAGAWSVDRNLGRWLSTRHVVTGELHDAHAH